MSLTLGVLSFVFLKVVPALFRVAVAVVVWLFGFVEAHHAAILTALSYLLSAVLKVDSWAFTLARGAFVYFGTSTVTGTITAIRDEFENGVRKPLVNLRQVAIDEWNRLDVAFASAFKPKPAPPAPAPVNPPAPEK